MRIMIIIVIVIMRWTNLYYDNVMFVYKFIIMYIYYVVNEILYDICFHAWKGVYALNGSHLNNLIPVNAVKFLPVLFEKNILKIDAKNLQNEDFHNNSW